MKILEVILGVACLSLISCSASHQSTGEKGFLNQPVPSILSQVSNKEGSGDLAPDPEADIFTIGIVNVEKADAAVTFQSDVAASCPGVEDFKIEDSFVSLRSRLFEIVLLKADANDLFNPESPPFERKEKDICSIKGTVKLPTNYILDIAVDTDNRPLYTHAKISTTGSASLLVDINFSTTSPFGHNYSLTAEGVRDSYEMNVLEYTFSDLGIMKCKDAKKIDTDVPFEIKAKMNLNQGLVTEDHLLSIEDAIKFHFRLFNCAP